MTNIALPNFIHAATKGCISALLALCFTVASTLAPAAEQKASGSIEYGTRLSSDERYAAEQTALEKAVEAYVVEKHPSHYSNYEKVKADINSDIQGYILDHVIIDEDKKNKRYTVVIRAKINEPKLNAKLLQPSGMAVGGNNALISFVFVAREQVGTISRTEKTAAQTKAKTQGISKERGENIAAQTKSETKAVTVKEERKNLNDEILWEVSTTTEVDTAMGNIFTEAGYFVQDAALLEDETGNMLSVNAFVNDYEAGDDISPLTRKEAIQGLRGLEEPVEYFALGTLDIDEQLEDPKTGNIKVAVSITGQVLSIKHRGAAVAKVGPELAFGEGPTILVAKNNALKNAAEQVAQQLVAKLSARNIR